MALAALSMGACRDNTGPSSANMVGLGFQVARTATAPALSATTTGASGTTPTITITAGGTRITRDGDVVLITKAEIVVRNVKLKSLSAVCSDDDDDDDDDDKGKSGSSSNGSSKSSSNTSSRSDDDDDCPEIRVGPYLVDVPVNGSDGARVSVEVPAGTYSYVRLWLHKITSSDSADIAFRQANPDVRDISLRLVGTHNGTPFTFTSDVNAKLTVPLTDPLVIGVGGGNVTVSVDFSTWFRRPSGGLYSPATANTPGQVRSQVQNNIRGAFRVFEDKNKDGRED